MCFVSSSVISIGNSSFNQDFDLEIDDNTVGTDYTDVSILNLNTNTPLKNNSYLVNPNCRLVRNSIYRTNLKPVKFNSSNKQEEAPLEITKAKSTYSTIPPNLSDSHDNSESLFRKFKIKPKPILRQNKSWNVEQIESKDKNTETTTKTRIQTIEKSINCSIPSCKKLCNRPISPSPIFNKSERPVSPQLENQNLPKKITFANNMLNGHYKRMASFTHGFVKYLILLAWFF